MGTTRQRRSERDVLRTGRPAIEHHWVPAAWAEAFANGDGGLEDEVDERWSGAAAAAWEAAIVGRGYLFSGTTGAEPEEFGEFEGQRGRLVQVAFSDQAVFDADKEAGVYCVTGCDDGPTEYVLRCGADAVVRLPANFEPRLLDPDKPCDDPSSEGVLPGFVRTEEGETGPGDIREGCADSEEIDARWTDGLADAMALALAAEGWTVEQALTATTRQGWCGELYGETVLFVVTKDRIAGARLPAAAQMGARPWSIARRE